MGLRPRKPLTAKEKLSKEYLNGRNDCRRLINLGFSRHFIHELEISHFCRQIEKHDATGLYNEGFNDALDAQELEWEAMEAVDEFTGSKLRPKRKRRKR